MKLLYYLKLFKFRYHITFIVVIISAYLSFHGPWYLLIQPLLILYITFNVLLYGGLYTINDIADVENDRAHPTKKYRPLPAGEINISQAFAFAFMCIGLGLLLGYMYFGLRTFIMYILFIAVNYFYTAVAKKIPYIDIIFNSITYLMRFVLGSLAVGGGVTFLLSLAVFFISFGFSCVRRIIELDSMGALTRPVLRYYKKHILTILQIISFLCIIILSLLDYPQYAIVYRITIAAYTVLVFGIYFSKKITDFYKWVWLH